jgi:5'/3'-nucleotidase
MTVPRRIAALLVLVCASASGEAAERRPRILLSNDDGITAPGLAAAYAELSKLGEVTVSAPADNQSGVGHGITFLEPILMAKIDPLVKADSPQGPWYRVSARPATCVRLALASLLTEKPDLVVSGINRGDNAGLAIYISGTLGAAREAAFDGIPSIAASLVESPQMDYGPGAALLARVAALTLKRGLPRGIFLSLNFPALPIRGVKVVPHSLSGGVNRFVERESPAHQTYFWNVWTPPADPDPETDAGALRDGYASVTPLKVDVNDQDARKVIEGWGLR